MSQETKHLYTEARDISKRLDYFILGFNVVFLGWTAVQSSLVPSEYSCLLIISWSLIIVSIVAGTLRQIFIPQAIESNIKKIHSDIKSTETFDTLTKILSGYTVRDEESNVIPTEKIKERIEKLNDHAKKAQERFKKINKIIAICFWTMYSSTLLGIVCFLIIRILSFPK